MKNEVTKKEKTNTKISLTISTKDIATLVGSTCNECYGVIGLTNIDSLMTRLIILKKESLFYTERSREPKTRSFPVRSTPRWDLRHSWAS